MFSQLTPCSPIWDGRIERFLQPWLLLLLLFCFCWCCCSFCLWLLILSWLWCRCRCGEMVNWKVVCTVSWPSEAAPRGKRLNLSSQTRIEKQHKTWGRERVEQGEELNKEKGGGFSNYAVSQNIPPALIFSHCFQELFLAILSLVSVLSKNKWQSNQSHPRIKINYSWSLSWGKT